MEAYIIKGYRSAICKAKKGSFRNYRSDDLAVDIIRKLTSDFPQLAPQDIDDVIVGCANPEGEQGLQIGRLIAARAIGYEVPGMTINRYCASGLEAIAIAVAKIRAGLGHCYIAGGTESMSLIPMTGYKLAPSYAATMQNVNYHVGMGHTAEAVAARYNISREQADQFSVRSHKLAAAALKRQDFSEQIVPVTVTEIAVERDQRVERNFTVDTDEGVREDTTLEALAKLKPAFKSDGVVTAGNASQTSDGAAFVLVMSEEMLLRMQVTPQARMVSCALGGVDPLYMGIGPVVSIPKALKQAGLNLQDIDMIELNEAFAVQALAVIQEAGLNPDSVNINGGAIALGHPLGCTGAKLSIQLLHQLKQHQKKYGMVTACVGGGQGIAGIFERF